MGAYETQGFKMDNTGRRIVVDPVTRIEGHMRCEVNLDSNNVIRNAVSTGTMWRGLEVILKGRDPRDAWAFVERICGVCTGCHALTSVRAVEDALGIRIPLNAHLIREMMAKTLQVHDHAVHFYHLHALDWVDVVSALNADPKKTSELQQLVSPSHPLSSPGYFRDVQNRLKKFVESGQLGPFSNGYWGSKAYVLPAEANLMAVTHYLEALDLQKEWVKVHTIFGGKNPHPNYMVGGVPCAINLDGDGAAGAPINMERLNFVEARIKEMIDFNNKGFFKLKQNNEYAERVSALLLDGEEVVDAYKAMRDGVVFTTKRIIAVNVQGITGSKKDFTSLPYKNIVAYSVETSGTFDLDSELEIYFSSLGKVKFEFTGKTSIVEISRLISKHLLG